MRPNAVIVSVGRPRTGKTTFNLQLIQAIAEQKGVLIFDLNGEAAFKDFPVMPFDKLPGWKSKGIYRIFHDDPEEFISAVRRYVYNAAVVFEDTTAYIDSSISDNLKRLLVDRRHRNVDMIFSFHSLRVIPPKLLDFTNYMIVGKTGDSEKYLKNLEKLPNPEHFISVWQRVMQNPSNFYREIIEANA
jgi:hypothetical protein